jgi:hypothetical protein
MKCIAVPLDLRRNTLGGVFKIGFAYDDLAFCGAANYETGFAWAAPRRFESVPPCFEVALCLCARARGQRDS